MILLLLYSISIIIVLFYFDNTNSYIYFIRFNYEKIIIFQNMNFVEISNDINFFSFLLLLNTFAICIYFVFVKL